MRGEARANRRADRPAPLSEAAPPRLPTSFIDWFERRGWQPRPHQLGLLANVAQRRSTLLIAPTGAGKTLAGFLPSLVALAQRAPGADGQAVHTLYVSPLKALASDVARNLMAPVQEMDLPVTVETRTGDTPIARRQRQRRRPPDLLLTTPEQVALILSHADAPRFFAGLRTVIVDEIHALAPNKRGDLLALALARLQSIAPEQVRIGLSATVARPSELRAYLVPQTAAAATRLAHLVTVQGGQPHQIDMLDTTTALPWAGHTTRYAASDILKAISAHRLSLLFVNTRSQAELLFQELWRLNEHNLPIALHHGSLDALQRRKVEAAIGAGHVRAVVSTSTLDLGVDWGNIDLVINVGAPKGASRLLQRVGRSNHRLEEASRALLVPSNRFEVLECRAAIDAAEAGTHDAVSHRTGALDVLAQHVWGMACSGPIQPTSLYREVRSAAPFANLPRGSFDRVLDFVATGGYALRAYERYARLRPAGAGLLRLAHPRLARHYRMNVGTIVEAPMIKIRLSPRRRSRGSRGRAGAGGRLLGEVEEYFIEQLKLGDTFAFAGEVWRFEGLQNTEAFVTRTSDPDPMIPAYEGGKFPLSTHLAERVRALLAEPYRWQQLPEEVYAWLLRQQARSSLPAAGEVLIETFARARRHYLVVYPFEGRVAHQTLGLLLTKRLDRLGARPLGFVANDYALAIWCLGDLAQLQRQAQLDLEALFAQDMLGDDLEAWLEESNLMRRTFRLNAVIAGLIQRRHGGSRKSPHQVTISSDLIYDVLRKHDPRHILLEAAWEDAATGLLDIPRLGQFLRRIKGRIRYKALKHVSPLAVPVLLEIGQERINTRSIAEEILREAAEALVREAMQGG
jgi:ATP-dependent helicase Lhr and Lhr-like helicase